MGALSLNLADKSLYSWFSCEKCYPQIMFRLQPTSGFLMTARVATPD